MSQADDVKKMSKVIAKTWTDEAFKKKLIADPVATLKAEGFVVDPRLKLQVHENTDTAFHLVIPVKPDNLSTAALGGDISVLAVCQYTSKTWLVP